MRLDGQAPVGQENSSFLVRDPRCSKTGLARPQLGWAKEGVVTVTVDESTCDRQLTLRSGRVLGYREMGPPDGVPIVGCHGGAQLARYPSQRQTFAAIADMRLIAPDRPGVGQSGLKPGRSFLDWADDVRELMDELDVERFAIFGVSSGGPYAAACACSMASRVSVLGLVSSAAPLWDMSRESPSVLDSAAPLARELILLASESKDRARSRIAEICDDELRQIQHSPDQWIDEWIRTAPEVDQRVLEGSDFRSLQIKAGIELASRGLKSYTDEFVLNVTETWGFSPRNVLVPAHIWHGGRDASVSLTIAESLADMFPAALRHFYPDEGHLLFHSRTTEILVSLADAHRRRVTELSGA
jgi:pimeloyl-ACP methyl ester carboxylesterase